MRSGTGVGIIVCSISGWTVGAAFCLRDEVEEDEADGDLDLCSLGGTSHLTSFAQSSDLLLECVFLRRRDEPLLDCLSKLCASSKAGLSLLAGVVALVEAGDKEGERELSERS